MTKHMFLRALRGVLLLPMLVVLSVAVDGIHHARAGGDLPKRPLIFIPGLLGSSLCRTGADGEQTVVWGTLDAIGAFPTLAMTAAADNVEPCGLIREVSYLGIYTQDVYSSFIRRLEDAGYREGETLFVFDYDWRLSVLDNARRLAAFVVKTIPQGQSIDIIAHSMGGLIARVYAVEEGGGERIERLITAGTPWRGSVQVFEMLENGWGSANLFLGGIEAFRRTSFSFPSTFDLMPDYEGCCGGKSQAAGGFDDSAPQHWLGLGWAGIDNEALPDLAAAKARQRRLRDIVEQPLPAGIEDVLVIGVDQRTPQKYTLERQEGGEARFDIHTSWEGDGTVMRDSALMENRVTYSTSFATHEAILSDPSVSDFVVTTLASSAKEALAVVPVRERTSVLTSLGDLVELVGVTVVADQPVYRTGQSAKAIIHMRLSVMDPVDARVIGLAVTRPDGTGRALPLTPAPETSDPTNPLEQSFSAEFETGSTVGSLDLTVTIAGGDDMPRQVKITVPVIKGAP